MPLKRIPIPATVDLEDEGRAVALGWGGDHRGRYGSWLLRAECPCAVCVDEMTGVRTLRREDVPPDVRVVGYTRVGRYALQFTFSDGHDTGIFTYEGLRDSCPCDACRAARGADDSRDDQER